jgi:hypothetical protein
MKKNKKVITDSVLSASSECRSHDNSIGATMRALHTILPKLFFHTECCDAAIATVGEFFRSKKLVLGGAARATPETRKTPILGLPKSRPSPLQKCAKKCVFG